MADKETEKNALKKISSTTANEIKYSLAAIAIAAALAVIIKWLGFPIADYIYGKENRPDWVNKAALAFFLAIIFSNPYQAWKEKNIGYLFFAKFILGLIIGFGLLISDYGASEVTTNATNETTDENTLSWFPWLAIGIPLLVMPVLFGTHAVERFKRNKDTPLKERYLDAALEYVNTSGPVVMMFVFMVCSLFYWMVAMQLDTLITFLTVLLTGVVAYCANFYDGTEAPITDEDEYLTPRSKTISEALSIALDISVKMLPGAMFLTGLIAVAMAFWGISNIDFTIAEDFTVLTILWPLAKAGAIAIAIVFGGLLLANIVGALLIALWAQVKSMSFIETKTRIDKFNEILYCGAMGKLFHGTLERPDKLE